MAGRSYAEVVTPHLVQLLKELVDEGYQVCAIAGAVVFAHEPPDPGSKHHAFCVVRQEAAIQGALGLKAEDVADLVIPAFGRLLAERGMNKPQS